MKGHGVHRYGDMGPPMDKGKGPAALHYGVDRRDNGLPMVPNGNAHASTSGAGLLSPSMDPIRGNAGAQALLRGVAQRSTGVWTLYVCQCLSCAGAL